MSALGSSGSRQAPVTGLLPFSVQRLLAAGSILAAVLHSRSFTRPVDHCLWAEQAKPLVPELSHNSVSEFSTGVLFCHSPSHPHSRLVIEVPSSGKPCHPALHFALKTGIILGPDSLPNQNGSPCSWSARLAGARSLHPPTC